MHRGDWIDSFWNKLFGVFSIPDNQADTRLPPSVLEKLGHSVALAKSGYMDACNTASQSCEEAAEICARKEKEALYSTKEVHDTLRPVHVIGIPSSGLRGGFGGLGMAAAASTMAFGVAAGRTALGASRSVSSHHTASKFKAAAASFKTMQGKFASLLKTACAFWWSFARRKNYILILLIILVVTESKKQNWIHISCLLLQFADILIYHTMLTHFCAHV